MKCEKCKPEDLRKNGKYKVKEGNTQKHIQRHICKKCGSTFSEHKPSYTKTEKRLLSFLINFLEKDLDGLNLKDFLEKSKEYNPGISNIELETYKETKPYGHRTEYEVKCKKPRLLICEDGNKIKIIKLPSRIVPSGAKSFNFILD